MHAWNSSTWGEHEFKISLSNLSPYYHNKLCQYNSHWEKVKEVCKEDLQGREAQQRVSEALCQCQHLGEWKGLLPSQPKWDEALCLHKGITPWASEETGEIA